MLFLKALAVGLGLTFGVEIALGLCIGLGAVLKGANEYEKH